MASFNVSILFETPPYALRIAGFFPALITILLLISVASVFVPFYRKPSNLVSLSYWKDVPRSFGLLFGLKRGVYGSSWMHIFDYLRPSFHPNDYDTSAFLDYYKERWWCIKKYAKKKQVEF